ncbi:MAG: AMP-binding protein [Aestuariivirga sp.]
MAMVNSKESENVPDISPQRSAALAWSDALMATASIEQHPQRLLADIILARAESHGADPALLSDRESFNFSDLAIRIGTYQVWANANGLGKGDTVALMMANRPDYVAAWLGLSRAGVIVALINTSLRGESLAHAIRVSTAKRVIADEEFRDHVALSGEAVVINAPPQSNGGVPPSENVAISDRALLIYTSGTTGLPKASVVSHRRVLNWALWFQGLLGNSETDRIYNCLPLYHSVGGVVAVAATLAAGGSTVIAVKFSASNFWNDIRRWQCTQFQYIGELCRYLLAQPPSDLDGVHNLRLAVGNGLRPDIWPEFVKRFRIPQIVEFYAATEGTFSLYNVQGPVGSIGKIPSFLRHRFKVALIKHDETGEPQRGGDGHCVSAAVNEPGEAIGLIANPTQFEGYTDIAETNRKVLGNVFETGDTWFRTGDMMRADKAGNYFFVDRMGDTFRWKGENVSTLEVANALSKIPGVKDAVVYGVSIPKADGKAGMASLEVNENFRVESFASDIKASLPNYAVPLFLRLSGKTQVTETFKHKKNELAAAGFDPAADSDPVYVLLKGSYRKLDDVIYQQILSGEIRL